MPAQGRKDPCRTRTKLRARTSHHRDLGMFCSAPAAHELRRSRVLRATGPLACGWRACGPTRLITRGRGHGHSCCAAEPSAGLVDTVELACARRAQVQLYPPARRVLQSQARAWPCNALHEEAGLALRARPARLDVASPKHLTPSLKPPSFRAYRCANSRSQQRRRKISSTPHDKWAHGASTEKPHENQHPAKPRARLVLRARHHAHHAFRRKRLGLALRARPSRPPQQPQHFPTRITR